jgi:hypothetical protein
MRMKQRYVRVARAITALESAVYEEISGLVQARAEPRDFAWLSELLEAVRAMKSRVGVNTDESVASAPRESRRGEEPGTAYFNEGEALVRRGSRRGGAGFYLQRVPWQTARRLVESIESRYGSRAFHPASLSREVRAPAYQTYAVLNLLTDSSFLEAPKRGSYRRPKNVSLLDKLDEIRAHLPTLPPGTEASATAEAPARANATD